MQVQVSPYSENIFMNSIQIDKKLLEILVCPVSRGKLEYDTKTNELISHKAGLAYPIKEGIPIMLESEARKLNLS